MPMLSIFVADGAGSAQRGGEGADLAIEAAAQFLDGKLIEPGFEASEGFAAQCIAAVRECVSARATREALAPRDFACTFLGIISSEMGTLVFQIGDGAVVVDIGNGLEVPIAPMIGEYANMTHFVTDENAPEVLAVASFPQCAAKVAAFTDGIQRLALNMAHNTAHEPFFEPMFATLANSTEDQEDQVRRGLSLFLQSSDVNERTDDDKTLVLAVLVPPVD